MAKSKRIVRKKRKKVRSLRKLGDILLDMEKLLQEMTDPDKHDMQWGEVRAQVMQWLKTHAPHAQEEYLDGTHPEDYYGPKRT